MQMLFDCADFLLASAFFYLITLPPESQASQPGPPQGITLKRITPPIFNTTEEPHWDAQKQLLYFADVDGETVYRYDPNRRTITHAAIGDRVSIIIPIKNTTNQFLIARATSLARLTWNGETTENPKIEILSTVDQDKADNRLNDGKADALGRLWIGSMANFLSNGTVPPDQGTVFKIPNNDSCQLEPMFGPVSFSNGITWSPDYRYMYYADTPTRVIRQWDYELKTGAISNTTIAFDFAKANVTGEPDGITIDKAGNIWIAVWDGWQVIRIDPRTGQLLNSVRMPVQYPTSVMFGGPDLSTLYVTSKRFGTPHLQLQPYAGCIFAIENLPIGGCCIHPVVDCVAPDCAAS